MPDITMCGSDSCPYRETCYRNEESGTKPSEFRQSFFMNPPYDKETGECEYYWPIAARE